MSYIDDAFDKLKSNLEITKTESEQAQTRHQLIRDHIEGSWKLLDHFLTGSYVRHTKTKKLKDVDIFVVVDPDGPQGSLADGTGTAAVLALRDVLAKRWSELDVDDNVVTVNYGDEDVASYEVAPVFSRRGGGYSMPNGASWMDTDPQEQAKLVTAKNKACDAKFVPFVKMVKGINREAGDPIEPSFLLEVMGLELVVEPFGRHRDEIRFFFGVSRRRNRARLAGPGGARPGCQCRDRDGSAPATLGNSAWLAGGCGGGVAARIRAQGACGGRGLARAVWMANAKTVKSGDGARAGPASGDPASSARWSARR